MIVARGAALLRVPLCCSKTHNHKTLDAFFYLANNFIENQRTNLLDLYFFEYSPKVQIVL